MNLKTMKVVQASLPQIASDMDQERTNLLAWRGKLDDCDDKCHKGRVTGIAGSDGDNDSTDAPETEDQISSDDGEFVDYFQCGVLSDYADNKDKVKAPFRLAPVLDYLCRMDGDRGSCGGDQGDHPIHSVAILLAQVVK